jgi:hypothetical protein
MKNGGRGAVEKKVDELREEILADASKLTTYGKKAGYLPPPPGMVCLFSNIIIKIKKIMTLASSRRTARRPAISPLRLAWCVLRERERERDPYIETDRKMCPFVM